MKRLILAVCVVLAWASPAWAQPELDASAIYLGVTGTTSRETAGSGSPEGSVTGPVGARYVDVATGLKWRKASGTGNTGWVPEISLTPCGTAGMFLRSTGSAWGCSTLVLPNGATTGDLPYASTTNTVAMLGIGGTEGMFLRRTSGGVPGWSTLVLPNSATSGRVLFAASTNTVSDASAGGMVQVDGSGFSSRAYGATRYGVHVYADPYGSARIDATDSTSPAWIPLELRATSVNVRGDAAVYGNLTVEDDLLPETAYVSNIGSAVKKFLTINAAELNVETLVAQDVMATIGGRVVVAPTTKLTTAVGTGDLSITVEHNNLASGDVLRLEAGGQVEFMSVAATCTGSGPYICSVTRDLDGTGANAWNIGDAVLNTGTTGDGVIDLFSTSGMLSGTGPTIMGSVRTSSTYSALSPRWVIGELNGLYDYSDSTYGFAAGDKDGAWIKVDATNGVRIGYDTTTKIELQPDGDAIFSGQVTSTSGTIGGFTLAANTISSGTDADYVAMSSAGANAFWAGDSTFADAEFSVTAAGELKSTSATITSASGTVTIGPTGIRIAVPSSASDSYAYRADTSFAGTNTFGAYFIESGSTREIDLRNTTTTSGKTPVISTLVSNDVASASITLTAPSAGTSVIAVAGDSFTVAASNFTVTPAGTITNSGSVIRSGVLTPTALSASVNNYNPGISDKRYVRLSTDGSPYDITGLFNLIDGVEVVMWNGGASTITLKHESASSLSVNRFLCPGAADFALTQYKAVTLRYDGTAARWIIVG